MLPDALASHSDAFFAPARGDALDALLGEYQQTRGAIKRTAAYLAGAEMQRATRFFFDAARTRFDRYVPSVDGFFDAAGAVKALDASYWDRALSLTDVLDFMPDARRQEWRAQIEKRDTPAFEEAVVRDNLDALMAKRMDFLSEMVDGVFQGLSGEHVTNRPEGFSKRMIIDACYNEDGYAGRKEGLVHDLRFVLSRLMGRDAPRHSNTRKLLAHVRQTTGVWHGVDAGAFRLRVYKKGTAHLEVHPQLAWRLNRVLAHRYPMAIPPAHRRRPAPGAKVVRLFDRPIPFAVLNALAECSYRDEGSGGVLRLSGTHSDKHLRRALAQVLEALGGIADCAWYRFDYPAGDVLGAVAASGMLPDDAAYQYYPTPENLAVEAVGLAEIGAQHSCLEPSAGLGALADLMPAARTSCVEVSALRCAALKAKGYSAICQDFLRYTGGPFERIVMNPPFSEGRALAHVRHAATLLAPGGRLVAIVPEGLKGKVLPEGLTWYWGGVRNFPGVSIRVAILAGDRT